MKRLVITFTLVLLAISVPVHAGAQPPPNTAIENLSDELASAYEFRDLGRLDAKKPYFGKIKIIVQHSLGDGSGEFEVKWVKSFGQAEKWLKSRETDEMPARSIRSLLKCAKGVCTYNFEGGILHNNLYLKKITYGFRKGRPYIKSILLLDGD